jgi:Rieske Fe-S protein
MSMAGSPAGKEVMMPHHEQTESLRSREQVTEPTDQRAHPPEREVTRRAVVAGTGILAVTAAIAGCSSYGGNQAAPPAATGAPGNSPPPAPSAAGLARTTDIPVGGGLVFPAEQVVVTQPAPAQFRAFSAICTHQGCTVKDVENGTINCPCHGSKFAAADGAVVNGPAKQPLPPREVVVDGNWVRVV